MENVKLSEQLHSSFFAVLSLVDVGLGSILYEAFVSV
jgi:hypothetical protein